MGMAASQSNLLQLTSRKNTIGGELEHLSLQRTALTREMNKISQEYRNALNAKTLKWSTNSGATYVDLSYNNLMRPGSVNNNTPYLITDNSGKVVLDDNYVKYAEMISPDGAAGGDWESNRVEILSALTGMSPEYISSAASAGEAVDSANEKVNALMEEVSILEAGCVTAMSETDFFYNCLGILGAGYNWDGNAQTSVGSDYEYAIQNNGAHWLLAQDPNNSKTKLREMLDQLVQNATNYLSDDNLEAFKEACDGVYNEFSININNAAGTNNYQVPVSQFSKDKNNYYAVRVDDILESLMAKYAVCGGACTQSDRDPSIYYYETVDRTSAEYQEYEAKKAELEAAKAEAGTTSNTSNMAMTAAEENLIDFYDKLFSAIAANGWTENSQVADNEYLNQMLQNNQYYITTVETATDNEGEEYFEYDSSIASNFENIFMVNDTDAANQALADYEYEKSIINEKESRIDTRQTNLETELAAINEMIKGIETVRDDNTERNFSIMS